MFYYRNESFEMVPFILNQFENWKFSDVSFQCTCFIVSDPLMNIFILCIHLKYALMKYIVLDFMSQLVLQSPENDKSLRFCPKLLQNFQSISLFLFHSNLNSIESLSVFLSMLIKGQIRSKRKCGVDWKWSKVCKSWELTVRSEVASKKNFNLHTLKIALLLRFQFISAVYIRCINVP